MRTRYAVVQGPAETVARYLPSNYRVVQTTDGDSTTVISGVDDAGWTLDDYVLPRLASGLYFGSEISSDEYFCAWAAR